MTTPSPLGYRPVARRLDTPAAQLSAANAAPTLPQCRLAIAIALYRSPARIYEIEKHVDLYELSEVTAVLAGIIEEFPRLSDAFVANLVIIAEQLALPSEEIDQLAFLHYMPDDFVSLLPSWKQALEILAPPLRPLGMLLRWRSDVVNGVAGQRTDTLATWKLDHLWRAACYEATALELDRQGLYRAAHVTMDAAAHCFQAGQKARGAA